MTLQMEKADDDGASSVASGANRPPAASLIDGPPKAPTPAAEPRTQARAQAVTTTCRTTSRSQVPAWRTAVLLPRRAAR
jgi:hypothetical protein